MKSHTIAETLILPAAIKMVKTMRGEEEAQKLKTIPLSDNTVKRMIDAVADDQESTPTEKLPGQFPSLRSSNGC